MDPFAILGVAPSATDAEIREAYLRRSKALHPDRYADASESERAAATRAMQELNVAYDALRGRTPGPSGVPPPTFVAPPPYAAPPLRPTRVAAPRRRRWIVIAIAVLVVGTGLALANGGTTSAPQRVDPATADDLTPLNGSCLTLTSSGFFEGVVDCTRPHDARVVQVVDNGVACPVYADSSLPGPRQHLCLDLVYR